MKLSIALLFLTTALNAQTILISSGSDSSSHAVLTVEGYIDAYYAYDANQPADGVRPYFVSQNQHNEFSINVAAIALRYSSPRVRATLMPGFGTYMNANYALEPNTLQHLLEGNVGFKIWKDKGVWVDMGILGSPYTNETALSLDQINLSRSFAPEYVPYYLSGAKVTIPAGPRLTTYFYLLNGWQQIEDQNRQLAGGTQLEFKPDEHWTLNWNTYFGDERGIGAPDVRMRYFSDVFAIWQPRSQVLLSACVYGGIQQYADATEDHNWWQANICGKFGLGGPHSLSARMEYFSDPSSVMIYPVTRANGFECSSVTLGYNYQVASRAAFRIEGRYFQTKNEAYYNASNQGSKTDFCLMAGLSARF